MEWISAEDRLPDKDGITLAVVERKRKNVAPHNELTLIYYSSGKGWNWGVHSKNESLSVIYWVPLIDLAKEESV